MKNFILLHITLFLFVATAFAQPDITLRNAPEGNAIELKWFSPQFLYPEGVNLYRMKNKSGVWEKLNEKPIVKGDYAIPVNQLAVDSVLSFNKLLIDEIPADSIQGIFLLQLLIQSFENFDYAKYCGVAFQDKTVSRGAGYEYKVAIIKNGVEVSSGKSKQLIAGDYKPLVPPKNIEVKLGKRRAKFKWLPEPDRYFGVHIYRTASDSAGELQITDRPLMPSQVERNGVVAFPEWLFKDVDLKEERTYTYRLAAVDYFGQLSTFSENYSIAVPDSTYPIAPDFLKGNTSPKKVDLKWLPGTSLDMVGQRVYRANEKGEAFKPIHDDLLTRFDTAFIDKVESGNYYYYVTSVDDAGLESRSNMIFVRVLDIEPPAPPSALVATSDTGEVILKWTASPSKDVMGYRVFRSIRPKETDEFVLVNTVPVATTGFIDIHPDNVRNPFNYRVVALDSGYNMSVPTEVVQVQLPDVYPPEAPFLRDVIITGGQIEVRWEPVSTEELKGFNVQRGIGDSVYQTINLKLVSSDQRKFVDESAKAGTAYYYRVLALDSSDLWSLPSRPVEARHMEDVGTLGDDLKKAKAEYRKKDKSIQFKWQVTDSEDCLGVVIYQLQSDKGVWKPITGRLNATEYKEKNIVANRQYKYEIRGYSRSGVVSKSSTLTIDVKE